MPKSVFCFYISQSKLAFVVIFLRRIFIFYLLRYSQFYYSRRPLRFPSENRKHLFWSQQWPYQSLKELPKLQRKYAKCFQNSIWFDSSFLNCILQCLCFLLCDLIFLFRTKSSSYNILLTDSVLLHFWCLFHFVLVLFLQPHKVRFEKEIFSLQMLAFLEVGL